MANSKLFRTVRSLNWVYGRGELVKLSKVRDGLYVATAQCQYGKSTFRVRFDGRTVRARNHQRKIGE